MLGSLKDRYTFKGYEISVYKDNHDYSFLIIDSNQDLSHFKRYLQSFYECALLAESWIDRQLELIPV
jgi:hypothetical protein